MQILVIFVLMVLDLEVMKLNSIILRLMFMQHGQLILVATCIGDNQTLIDTCDIIVMGMSDVNAIIRI